VEVAEVGPLVLKYLEDRTRSGHLNRRSLKSYRWTLLDFARSVGFHRDIKAIQQRHVAKWLTERRVSATTTVFYLAAVRSYFHWAITAGHTKVDPTIGYEAPKRPRRLPRAMEHDEVKKILINCATDRERVMVLLMCQEGLRAVEISRLQVGDIDPKERTLRVVGKGGHERILPLSEESLWAIRAYKGSEFTVGPLITSERRGAYAEGVAPQTVSRVVGEAMKRAGVGGCPHRLRHTAASDMLDNGAHIRDVQAALGHASLATTQIYLRLRSGADLRPAMGGRRYWHPEEGTNGAAVPAGVGSDWVQP
jgi:integrase/recombinase XerC